MSTKEYTEGSGMSARHIIEVDLVSSKEEQRLFEKTINELTLDPFIMAKQWAVKALKHNNFPVDPESCRKNQSEVANGSVEWVSMEVIKLYEIIQIHTEKDEIIGAVNNAYKLGRLVQDAVLRFKWGPFVEKSEKVTNERRKGGRTANKPYRESENFCASRADALWKKNENLGKKEIVGTIGAEIGASDRKPISETSIWKYIKKAAEKGELTIPGHVCRPGRRPVS